MAAAGLYDHVLVELRLRNRTYPSDDADTHFDSRLPYLVSRLLKAIGEAFEELNMYNVLAYLRVQDHSLENNYGSEALPGQRSLSTGGYSQNGNQSLPAFPLRDCR